MASWVFDRNVASTIQRDPAAAFLALGLTFEVVLRLPISLL